MCSDARQERVDKERKLAKRHGSASRNCDGQMLLFPCRQILKQLVLDGWAVLSYARSKYVMGLTGEADQDAERDAPC